MEQNQNPNLSPEQKAVLFNKATEAPFSGEYLRYQADGTYTCANCGAKLFESDRKFESRCGWPSFDKSIEGAVKYIEDISHRTRRVEVVCANCGGHLGHIFPDGPRETTGQRFCINSLSLGFEEKNKPKA
jgi:peptide-methionine (R)-S-oxide reductase